MTRRYLGHFGCDKCSVIVRVYDWLPTPVLCTSCRRLVEKQEERSMEEESELQWVRKVAAAPHKKVAPFLEEYMKTPEGNWHRTQQAWMHLTEAVASTKGFYTKVLESHRGPRELANLIVEEMVKNYKGPRHPSREEGT